MEEIAQVYSRSLFEVAKEHGKLDRIRDELAAFADALAQNRELSVFFFSPYFSTEEKEDGLRRTVVDADPTLVNFLELLIENHRMPVIYPHPAPVRRALGPREPAAAGRGDERRRARPLRDRGARGSGSASRPARTCELESIVDPDILGGIVLRVGNSILDASIRHRLEQLAEEKSPKAA